MEYLCRRPQRGCKEEKGSLCPEEVIFEGTKHHFVAKLQWGQNLTSHQNMGYSHSVKTSFKIIHSFIHSFKKIQLRSCAAIEWYDWPGQTSDMLNLGFLWEVWLFSEIGPLTSVFLGTSALMSGLVALLSFPFSASVHCGSKGMALHPWFSLTWTSTVYSPPSWSDSILPS